MDVIICILSFALGALGIVRPSFFYNTNALTSEQVTRNKRILRRCGIGLILLGIFQLVLLILRH